MIPPVPSTQQIQVLKEREVRQIKEANTKSSPWEFTSLAETSPSVLDGLDPAKQARWRREFLHLIYKAGHALQM